MSWVNPARTLPVDLSSLRSVPDEQRIEAAPTVWPETADHEVLLVIELQLSPLVGSLAGLIRSIPYTLGWRRAEAHLRSGGAMEICLSKNWEPDEIAEIRDRLKANHHQPVIPTIPPPAVCSEEYALGWHCAGDYMRDGMSRRP